jgi:fatty-acid desaturase
MTQEERVGTIDLRKGGSPVAGDVRWDKTHSLWQGTMLAGTLFVALPNATPGSVLMFVLTTGAGLLLGHSVGFHRLLIHRSFAAPLWLERLLVWIGTCVGISGPLWMIRTHDLRDWAQRQTDCHPYLAHRTSKLRDAWWQMHCRLILRQPPSFDLGAAGADSFYRFLERTWMIQQVPIALLLYAVGGWAWVAWGVCARITTSTVGHWFIGHLAHRTGPQSWLVVGAGVQAHDVPWAAIPTMGEAWHNNHHAFPGSAKLGLYPGQSDWGYVFIRLLERCRLAWNVRTPEHLPPRHLLFLHDYGTNTVSTASGSISG